MAGERHISRGTDDMGDIADMMLEGTLCQSCGEYMDHGGAGLGFPTDCPGCSGEKRRDEKQRRRDAHAAQKAEADARKASLAEMTPEERALAKRREKRRRYRRNKAARKATPVAGGRG